MDFFTLVGLAFTLYIFVYVVLLSVVDCDLGLLWALYLGKKVDSVKGKVIWVTGASSGIGEFLSIELAKNGAKLALSGRSVANLEITRDNCIASGGKRDDILIVPFDMTQLDCHQEMFDKIVEYFGKLDVLVNNAGRSQRAVWEEIEVDVDKEIFDLNVFSVLHLSRLVCRYFKARGGGHLVVTSSLAGLFGAPFSGSYTASKHAIHGYFKTLRTEKLGSPIDITLLCPGPVFSNVLRNAFTHQKGKTFGEDMHSLDKRLFTDRCAYLCSVAIANRLDEAWMGVFPVIPLTYVLVYFPNIAKKIALLMGAKQLMELRDSRQTVPPPKD